VPDAVLDGETGLLVDGRNVPAIAEAVVTLLHDQERAAKMGAVGAAWVHAELSWDAVAARLRSLLHEVVGQRPTSERRRPRTG
jgi:phosphatidylinositol alpha-1,6-mannosyltransferase